MQAMAAAAVERHGGIDVLCANAGIYPQTKIEEMDPAEWDEVMATNLKSGFLCLKACLPALKESEYGRVVLTSSITGPVTGFPGWSHYGATKSGQLGFIRTACIEVAKYGITVNAVLPGNMLTEGLMDLGEEYLRTMAASIPLGRLGTVEDIGNAALFLASERGRLHHGADDHPRWRPDNSGVARGAAGGVIGRVAAASGGRKGAGWQGAGARCCDGGAAIAARRFRFARS